MTKPEAFIWQRAAWPKLAVDRAAVSAHVAAARRQQNVVLGLAKSVAMPDLEQVAVDIWVDEALATAAIEGEKLNLESVRSSVMRRLGMHAKRTPGRNVDGLVDVMRDATASYAEPLSAGRLCRWQSALFPGGTSSIKTIEVGKFRTSAEPMEIVSGPIGRQKTHYRAPLSKMVAKEIERFLAWFNAPLKNTKVSRVRRNQVADHPDGLVRAAIAHLWFETIHPFEDGNGRVGRAIVDLALAQDLKSSSRIFSVSRQLMQERDAYYQALERAQRGTVDVTEWVIWFLQQFNHACLKSQAVISEALAKSQYWAAHRGHRMNARQHKVILKLLDAGREGFEGGLGADKYCNLTGASKPTATRDLADLLKDGWVTVTGAGRSTRYWANIDWHGADRASA